MVTYIRSDLDFILNQIKIAEEHSRYVAGDPTARPLFGADGMIPANNISWGLRTVDGSNNNIVPGQEHYGSADQPFPTCSIRITGRRPRPQTSTDPLPEESSAEAHTRPPRTSPAPASSMRPPAQSRT